MPRYEITAPDGRRFEVTAPEGASQAEVLAYAQANYTEPPKKSTVGSELKRGAQQVASSMQTAYGALTGSPEEAARSGIERSNAISQVAGEGVGLEPVKRAYREKGLLSAAGEAVSQIPRALAGQGANLAAMAGGARLGAMAGSAVAPGPGTLIGGALGAGAALLPQFFGANVERQASEQMERGEPVKIDRTKAGTAAAGQAALEGAGAAFTLGKGVVKGVLGIADDAALTTARAAQQLEVTARRSLTGTVVRGAGRGAVVEMPVEVAQQVIERAQAGLALTSPEALSEYGEAAYQAGLVGGPLGAAGNVVTRGQARSRLEAATPPAAPTTPTADTPPTTPPAGPETLALPAPETQAALPAPEKTLALPNAPTPTSVANAIQERERLKARPQTADITARVAELDDLIANYNQMDVEAIRDEQAQQQANATRLAAEDAEARRRFPNLAGEVDAPATPAVPGALTMQDIQAVGIPLRVGMDKWFEQNVIGKTLPDLQELVASQPELVKGKSPRAKILRELTAPQPATFEETPSEPTPPPTPAVEQRDEPRAGEPSVGVPSEPAASVAPDPGAGVPTAPPESVPPDGRGLVPAGRPAVQGDAAQGAEPAAVTSEPAEENAPKAYEQSPAIVKLSRARTKAQLEAALDEIARIRRDPTNAEHDAINEFVTDALVAPGFEPMFTAALDRTRPRQAPPAAPAKPVEREKPTGKAKPARAVPAAFYEPIGIDARTGAVKRGKQMLVQPIDDKRAAEYIKAKEQADEGDTSDLMALFEEIEQEGDIPDTQGALFDAEGKVTKEAKVKAGKQRRFAAPRGTGQTVADLEQEIQDMPGKMGDAARKLRRSGKLKLEEGDGTKGGMYDGKRAILYARGIPKGQAFNLLLHEVGAHMGMRNLLGQKQYDAVIDRIIAMLKAPNGSMEKRLASTAYDRIPAEDRERGAEVARDELVAYFVEVVAYAESSGQLPKRGPLRVMWDQIKTAITTNINRVLGTSFGVNELTPQQIADIATAAVFREAETGVATSGEVKKQFSVAPSTQVLIDSMGELDGPEKSGLARLIEGWKANPELGYVTKFRVLVADSAAAIEHRLRDKFDGAVRNSLGSINPMGLYRQAQDHAKMLLEYFQQGSLAKDPATGQWYVTTAQGVRPPVAVYELIDKWAAKNGYTRELATKNASRILEGVRLDAMRESNLTQGTNFSLHLKYPEIDQLVREYKADPDLQAMSKLMDEARIDMVNHMVSVGRLTPETGKVWADTIGYVPFDRLDDEKFTAAYSKVKKISNKGIAQVGKLPELVGSVERPVGNVFDNYLNTLGWMVGQTLKTDATVQTLRALERIQQSSYLGPSNQGKPNAVGMYVKGEMRYWEVPSKYDVMAFKDLTVPKANWVRAMGQFSNFLRKSVTVLPPFALKQVTDDVQRAIMTSGVKNPGALLRIALTNFPKLALAELRGIQHPEVRKFGALGLTGAYDFEAGKPATSLLKTLGYKKRGKFETLIDRLDGITRASDLAVRAAIYEQTMKESNNDQLLAQTRAREFINFRRRGSSQIVGDLVTVIPFFNAYIQGMDVLYRAASGKDSSASVGRAQARRMFMSRAVTVTMLASLYALSKDDEDEDYKEMDLRTRDGNWILPGGYKLPVPGELGAIFKVIPERVVEYMKRQGTPEEQTAWEATRTALSYIFEQYIGRTVPVPQAVKPLLEAWANKSFLTGRELEGIYQKQQDPSQRRGPATSELAIAIAEFSRDMVGVEVSPIMIDNTLRGYFGSTAALLTATTDSLLNPTRVDRPLHKWALLSNYMYDPVGTRRITEFYEEREKVGRATVTLNELMKTDMDRAVAYAEAHTDELQLESAVNATLQNLENTRAYRKFLNSPDGAREMPAEEREAALKEIKQLELQYVGWLREAKVAIRSQ